MPRHSVMWIGPGEGLAERGLDTIETLDVSWSADGDAASSLAVADFDLALLEDTTAAETSLRNLRRHRSCPPLVVLTDVPEPARARQLLGAGADDVWIAPPDAQPGWLRAALATRLGRISRTDRLRHGGPIPELPGVIARSPAIRSALGLANQAAHSSATVLLAGETGSGKEVVARAIHSLGPRAAQPFIAVNCAAFPDTLLESELFGHVRGAFTGADRDKTGLFEEASGGTLFLDEIGETAGSFQAKLLRVLQEREVRPVGSTRVRRVDARVLAASNRELQTEAEQGRFRIDLYYRLAVFPIRVPALRERAADVLALAEHFLELHGRREHKPGCRLAPAAEQLLLAHDWPGNVRELENEMLRALALAEPGEWLGPDHLSEALVSKTAVHQRLASEGTETLRARVARFERMLIRAVLERNGGKRTTSARELGLTREGLHKKMKRLGVD